MDTLTTPPPSCSPASDDHLAVVLKGLVFAYPGATVLKGISASIAANSITALVGPNGAGKTTLLRCLAGLETPLAGSIHIQGIDVLADPRAAHRVLGFLPDVYGLYNELSVYQCLWYAASSRGIIEAADAAEQTISLLNLQATRDRLLGELSHGQRQRLAIGQSIVHKPALLLLDEPANGLDPDAREELARLLQQLAGAGMTIIVSSHILAELNQYATAMLMMQEGLIIGQHTLNTAAHTDLSLLYKHSFAQAGELPTPPTGEYKDAY